jgi:hypothetical protein
VVYATKKYGSKGFYNAGTFKRMPKGMRETLFTAANHSLASKTWSTYGTVGKHLKSCEKHFKKTFKFPLKTDDIVLFIGYLLTVRGVKGSTVDTYISALRAIHLAKGVAIKELRPDIVKNIISGQKNLDSLRQCNINKRLPVTLSVLKLLKLEIRELDEPNNYKRLIWAVCSLNFFGALRVHESLSINVSNFDPINTLLGRDLTIKSVKVGKGYVKIIQLKIKSPKECRAVNNKIIDIYENKGPLCPVRAIRKLTHVNYISRNVM